MKASKHVSMLFQRAVSGAVSPALVPNLESISQFTIVFTVCSPVRVYIVCVVPSHVRKTSGFVCLFKQHEDCGGHKQDLAINEKNEMMIIG